MTSPESTKPVPSPQSAADLAATLPNPGSDGYVFFEHSANHPAERSTDFRLVNAWWAIEMAYLSYATDKEFALSRVADAQLTGAAFGFDQATPPHILVAHNDDLVVVAFRGTRIDCLSDTLADMSFLPVLTTEGLVHRGFHNALTAGAAWAEAQKHISGIGGNQVILFTGHSLGAALATIARRLFKDPSGRQIALYTMGSPRVGDQAFYCPQYPSPAYRLVNDEDVITHIPTPPVYGHVGTALAPDGKPISDARWEGLEHQFAAAAGVLGVFSLDSRKARLRAYLSSMVKPLGDHAPRAYAAKIWNALISQ